MMRSKWNMRLNRIQQKHTIERIEIMLKRLAKYSVLALATGLVTGLAAGTASSEVHVQCPDDTNGNAIEDAGEVWTNPNQVCMHLTGGDGYVNMSDIEASATAVVPLNYDGSYAGPAQQRGRFQYIFGFSDVTGMAPEDVLIDGVLAAQYAAPTIELREGQEFYLSLTNVGMAIRPDLFDPHTVHWHGYPDATAAFDGLPDVSVSINMGNTLTYYYNVKDPGTFLYHCHVEATEHMQMGMLGQLFVKSAQGPAWDDLLATGGPGNAAQVAGHTTGDEYVYNDGDGSTRYDVEFALQMSGFDPEFHDASYSVQPLPFAEMNVTFPLLNGRGYPETIIQGDLHNSGNGLPTQPYDALVEATAGETILLRLSNLSVTQFYTLMSPSITMKVVGTGAHILRGPDSAETPTAPAVGEDLYYETNSVTLGGGQAFDLLLDTAGMSPGTYFLYTSNLHNLSNNTEERGGIMTEIRLY